jgi:hypothetical protein
MKKVMLKTAAILCGLAGLFLVPDLLYNACGIAGIGDCADGPKGTMALHIVVIIGLFVVSYWLFRMRRQKA